MLCSNEWGWALSPLSKKLVLEITFFFASFTGYINEWMFEAEKGWLIVLAGHNPKNFMRIVEQVLDQPQLVLISRAHIYIHVHKSSIA